MGDSAASRLQDPLSERELEVLEGLASGASDREIAQALHLSINTIKWYNRQIYSKLGVAGREEAAALAAQRGLLEGADEGGEGRKSSPPNNLPGIDLTSFIGRRQEMEELRRHLGSHRLTTLTGPGGVGKSRLALQVATDRLAQFPGGAYFIELASLRDPMDIPNAVAEALQVEERSGEPIAETLRHHLGEQRTLLLFDNFEHLLAGAPFIKALLEGAAGVVVLATSREQLSLYGERVVPLKPLATDESVALFYQRARDRLPSFDPDKKGEAAVRKICRRVDNLPLAVELAAGRVPAYPPDTILEHLLPHLNRLESSGHDRPDRHQTLQATIDWSYQLLDEEEQLLLQILSLFVAGASLDAVKAVAGPMVSTDIFRVLESLIRKSLIWQRLAGDGEPRFGMLDTVRAYARQKVGEGKSLWEGITDFYLSETEDVVDMLTGPSDRSLAFIRKTEQELPNLRAAFEWQLATDGGARAAKLFINLFRFFWAISAREGLRWADKLNEAAGDIPPSLYAHALATAGDLSYLSGDMEGARALAEDAVDLVDQEEGGRALGQALCVLGVVNSQEGKFEEAESHLRKAVAVYEGLGSAFDVSTALNALGELMRLQGEFDEAKQFYEKCLRLRSTSQEGHASPAIFLNLAAVDRHRNDDQSALRNAYRALVSSRDRSYLPVLTGALDAVAGLRRKEAPRRSVMWMATAESARQESGYGIELVDRELYDRDQAELRHELGEEAYNRAWRRGLATPLERAVEEAMEHAPVVDRNDGSNHLR